MDGRLRNFSQRLAMLGRAAAWTKELEYAPLCLLKYPALASMVSRVLHTDENGVVRYDFLA